MSTITLVLAIALAAFAPRARAYFDYQSSVGEEMNRIRLAQYRDFPQKWKLITVRYREDTQELRFTYANPVAAKALKALRPTYPDGAVFGKVSYQLEADFVFPSSLVPRQVRRYQLMVKNRKAYPDSDGWGYALFTDAGKLFNEDVGAKTRACVACHRIVPERDHVFSRELHAGEALTTGLSRVPFKAKARNDFSGPIQDLLPNTAVESVEGALREHAFSGTLDEIVPALLARVRATEKSAVFYVDAKNFSAVTAPKAEVCDAGKGQKYRIVIHHNGGIVRNTDVCIQR